VLSRSRQPARELRKSKLSCPASDYAYYSKSQYQADSDGGYTAGSVVLSTSAAQSNLDVDTGNVTSDTNNVKSQFNFNF
jgi:hypothetical protein